MGGVARTGKKLLPLLKALHVDYNIPSFLLVKDAEIWRNQRGSDGQRASPCSVLMVFSKAAFLLDRHRCYSVTMSFLKKQTAEENGTGKAFMTESCKFSSETFHYF